MSARLAMLALLVVASAARAEEPLVPVVVAAVDMGPGQTVTMEMISQRSAPRRLITPSVVKPDSASYIVNQKVLVPLLAGDLLLWSHFETTKGEHHRVCREVIKVTGDAKEQIARARAAIRAGAKRK
ncbi:MAG: SAF domain-containing protein [Myxococcota bacterium]